MKRNDDPSMNDLIRLALKANVFAGANYSIPVARELVDAFFEQLVESVITYNRRVRLPGIGTFFVAQRASCRIRNSQTKEPMTVGPTYRLGFSASKSKRYRGSR